MLLKSTGALFFLRPREEMNGTMVHDSSSLDAATPMASWSAGCTKDILLP